MSLNWKINNITVAINYILFHFIRLIPLVQKEEVDEVVEKFMNR